MLVVVDVSLSRNLGWSGGLYKIPISIGLFMEAKYQKKALYFIGKVISQTKAYIVSYIAGYPSYMSVPIRSFQFIAVYVYLIIQDSCIKSKLCYLNDSGL